MLCAACELRVVTVPVLEARLAQKRQEAELRAKIEGALPYAADMLCLIAQRMIPGLRMRPYTQLIDPDSAPKEDMRSAMEIISDVLDGLEKR